MNYLCNFDERSDDEREDLVVGVDEEVNDGIAADAPNVGRVRAAVPNITCPRNGGTFNGLPWTGGSRATRMSRSIPKTGL